MIMQKIASAAASHFCHVCFFCCLPLFGCSTRPAAIPAPGVVGDWAQWRGPNRSSICDEKGLLQDWPEGGPPLLWTVQGLGDTYAPVSVQGDKIYTVGRRDRSEVAIALDRDRGVEIWEVPLWPAAKDELGMRQISLRQPTADGERVYVTSADGDLACLDTKTGRVRWQKNYRDDFLGRREVWGYCDFPLVDGSRLICVPGGNEAAVIALDKFTGAVLWKCPAPLRVQFPSISSTSLPATAQSTRSPSRGLTPTHSSLVVAEIGGVRQYVYRFMELMAGVSADGKLLWSIPLATNTTNVFTPIVRGNQVFSASGYGRGYTLVQIFPPSAVAAEWAVETIYHSSESVPGLQGNTILQGDCVYSGLKCIDFVSGQKLWQIKPGENLGPEFPVTLWADGRMYCRYATGPMALIAADRQGYQVKGTFTIPDARSGRVGPPPEIAGGRLYVRERDALYCYDVTREGRWKHFATTRPVVVHGTHSASSPTTLSTPVKRPGDPDAIYLPTPEGVVQKMLDLAGVKENDLVYDLGSGDGRIVIAAAKNFGAHGIGIEIDADLVNQSIDNAKREGVSDRVTIKRGDLFDADFSNATVVALYLLPELNARLLPKLRQLPAGTRIVSHQFLIPGIKPDQVVKTTPKGEVAEHAIYLWITPLSAE